MIAYDKNILFTDLQNYDFLFPVIFFTILLISSYLFLTTGDYPGYLQIASNINLDRSIVAINMENETHHIYQEKKYEEITEKNIQNEEELKKDDELMSQKPEIKENLTHEPFTYCEICKIEKYVRMKHCDKCERCVHKFDHHCFWIGYLKYLNFIYISIIFKGACVGELNHGKFWTFLFFQTLTSILGFFIVKNFFSQTYLYIYKTFA